MKKTIVNAFTCTGAYAVLIMSGLKRTEKWDEVQSWPGCIVGTMDYDAMDRVPCNTALASECRIWNEGYPNWWILSNIRRLPTPIPCRGNVGMWRLPPKLSNEIEQRFAEGVP